MKFDEPIAARGTGTNAQVPWGAGVQRLGTGTTYDITSVHSGLTTVNAVPANPLNPLVPSDVQYGIPAGATGIDLPGANFTFNSGPAGSIIGSQSGISSAAWIGVHGVDFGGDGIVDNSIDNSGAIENDEERSYITMASYSIMESFGGALPSGSAFVFSMDGEQYGDTLAATIAIPEPSRALLLSAGCALVLLRRRRR